MSSKHNVWALGLLKVLEDKTEHILSSDVAVVIRDKYPKAKHHYLCLPRAHINSIYDIKREHLTLLKELHLLALNVIEVKGEKIESFQIGFHVEPSMQQLHLHVISKDFVSAALKTSKHWNSFNTRLFLPYEDLYAELELSGCVKRLNSAECERLRKTELRCNQCVYVAKTMPTLKNHLLEHYNAKCEIQS